MYVNYISVNRTQSIKEGENVSYRKRYHKQNLETNRENICKQDMNQEEKVPLAILFLTLKTTSIHDDECIFLHMTKAL